MNVKKILKKDIRSGFYAHDHQLGEVFMFTYSGINYLAVGVKSTSADRLNPFKILSISNDTNNKPGWLYIGNIVGITSDEDIIPISHPEKYKKYEKRKE